MTALAVAFLGAMASALLLTPVVRDAAVRGCFLDRAVSFRKVHGRPVPRLGGMALVASCLVPLAALCLVSDRVRVIVAGQPRLAAALLAGGLAICVLGLVDDLCGARAAVKLAVQGLAALAMWWAGFRMEAIGHPFGAAIDLGAFGLPLTVAWIVGVTNAFNLIDGLDGLAGGVALCAVGVLSVLAWRADQALLVLFLAALAGSLLGFLRYNLHPASIFLGDGGSLFLGFVLATASLRTAPGSSATVALLAPVVALGLPIGDTLLAITRRAARGQPVLVADRGHVHHRLMEVGLTHRGAVAVLHALSLTLAVVAVALHRADALQTVAFGVALAAIAALLLALTGYIRDGNLGWLRFVRRQNRAMHAGVRITAEQLRAAGTLQEVWRVLVAAAPALGVETVTLAIPDPARSGERVEMRHPARKRATEGTRLRCGLREGDPGQGFLEMTWRQAAPIPSVVRDREIAVEGLSRHLHAALERIRGDAEEVHPRVTPMPLARVPP